MKSSFLNDRQLVGSYAMGAWGHEPFDSDEAMEWVANSIEKPLLESVKETLSRYIATPDDDVMKHDVEAAVALLLDLSANPSRMKYCRFSVAFYATEDRLWDLAIAAISTLRADQTWLDDWSSPEKKLQLYDEMLSELKLHQQAVGDP